MNGTLSRPPHFIVEVKAQGVPSELLSHTGTWWHSQDSRVFCSYSLALTTVEGLISRAISGLEQDQPARRVSWDFLMAAAQGITTSLCLNRVFSFLCS